MRRHPLLWRLAALQVCFCLLLTWLIWTWGLSVERSTYFLTQADRLLPTGLTPRTHILTHGVVPPLLALLLGLALYRQLVVPLNRLRDRANALRADDLAAPGLPLQDRRDELGELAQAFEHMATRLRQSLEQQRMLLRTLSHELRTPLARLRIFTPYQRLTNSGSGFGLGLAIARRAIKLQGGRLWASNANPGLCLHLLLPVAEECLES